MAAVSRLNHKNHQKSNDGCRRIDYQLPSVAVAEQWPYEPPNQDDCEGGEECGRTAGGHRVNRVMKKPAETCLVLHKKSCTRPKVKAAVKHVRQLGIDVDIYIPWSRKDLRRFVRQAIKDGAQRIVAGGGDGTLNAVVNAMIRGDIRPLESCHWGQPTILRRVPASTQRIWQMRWNWRVPEAPRRSTSGA
jgi:hypothetical protein